MKYSIIIHTFNICYLLLHIITLLNGARNNDHYDYDSESYYDLNQIENENKQKDKSNIELEDEYLIQKRIAEERERRLEMEAMGLNDPKQNSHNIDENGVQYEQLRFSNENQNIQRERDPDSMHINYFNNDNELINRELNKIPNNNQYKHTPHGHLGSPQQGHHRMMEQGFNNRNIGNVGPNKIENTEANQGFMNWMVKNPLLGTIYEGLAMMFLVGFVYRCIFMRNSNDKNMMSWYKANKEILQAKFDKEAFYTYNEVDKRMESELHQKDNQPKDAVPIYKHTDKYYIYHAEEGVNIQTIDIRFEFHKNQDYLFLVTQFLVNEKDRMIFELLLNFTEYYPQLFIFSNPKETKNVIGMNKDIKELCKNCKFYQNFGLDCSAEDNELINHILSQEKIRRPLGIFKGMIDLILFTEVEGKNK